MVDMGTNKAIEAIMRIAAAICETVAAEGSNGAPESSVYLAMQAGLGCTRAQYDQFVGALIEAGRLRRSGNLLFAE